MCSAAGTACSRSFVASTQTWYTVQCGRQRAALRSEHVQDHLAHGGKGAQARWADGGAFFDNRPGNWGGSGLKRSRSGACQCGWARAWRRAASRLCILQAMRQITAVYLRSRESCAMKRMRSQMRSQHTRTPARSHTRTRHTRAAPAPRTSWTRFNPQRCVPES